MSNLANKLAVPLAHKLASAITAALGGLSLTQHVQRIYSGGLKGVMYDLTDPRNLYQDSSRTTQVASVNDPIGSATDLSGNGLHANASADDKRPIFNGYATFDGSNDALSVSTLDLSATDKVTVVALVYWSSVSSASFIADFTSGTAGGFALTVEPNPYPLRVRLRGDTTQVFRTESAPPSAPRASIITAQLDLSGALTADEISLRIDGALAAVTSSGTAAGGGNFGNKAFHIGAFGGATFPAAMRIHRFAVFGKTLSAAELAIAEAWAGEPIGFFP